MKIIKGFLFLSCTSISLLALYYFDFEVKGILNSKTPELLKSIAYRGLFYLHIAGGVVAMVTSLYQLFKIRKLHKLIGRVYAYSVVIGGLTGMIVSFYAYGGPISQVGLFTLSIFWLFTTLKGVQYAKLRKFMEHRKWMHRSFALTYAAFTFRMILLIVPLLGGDFKLAYNIACWIWLLNLGIVFIIQKSKKYPSIESIFNLQ